MSQIYKSVTSGGLPPDVPTSFETQDGTAVPVANIIIVNAIDSIENNDNGIITKGGVVGTGTANEIDVVITNRVQGSTQTVGETSSSIFTFTPTVIGVYTFDLRISAYNITSSLGAGYNLFGAIRFDGVNSTICDAFDEINNEEGTMSNSDIFVDVSGADFRLRATGYIAQTINWGATGLYTFVGA